MSKSNPSQIRLIASVQTIVLCVSLFLSASAVHSQEAGYDWIRPVSGNVIDVSLDGTRILTFTDGNTLVFYNGLTGDPIDTIRRKTVNEFDYGGSIDSSENSRGVIVSGRAVTYSHSSHRDSANTDLVFITRYRETTRTIDTIGTIDRRVYYPAGEVCHLTPGHRSDQFLITLFKFKFYCVYLVRVGTTLAFTIDGDTLRFDGVVPMTDRDKLSPRRSHSLASTVHYHSGEVRPYEPPRTWRSAGGRLNENSYWSYTTPSDEWYPFDNGIMLVRPYYNLFRFGGGHEFSIAGVTDDERGWFPFSTNHYVYTISRDVANPDSVVGRFIVRDLMSEGEDTLGAFPCDATVPLNAAVLAPEGNAAFVQLRDSLVRINVDYSQYSDVVDTIIVRGPDSIGILDTVRLEVFALVDGIVTGITADCDGAIVRELWDTLEISPTKTGLLDVYIHVEIDSLPSKTRTVRHQIYVPRPKGVVAFDRAFNGVLTRLTTCRDIMLVPAIIGDSMMAGPWWTTAWSRMASLPQQVDDGFLREASIELNLFDCEEEIQWRHQRSVDSNDWYPGGVCETILEVKPQSGDTTVWGRVGDPGLRVYRPEYSDTVDRPRHNRTHEVIRNGSTGRRILYWNAYFRHDLDLRNIHATKLGYVWIMPDEPVDQFYRPEFEAYSADAGYGDQLIMTMPFDRFTTSITGYDLRTDSSEILLKNIGQTNWRMTDAIMVRDNMIISTYGIHESDSTGRWSTTVRWPFDDVIDVVRMTPTRSCLIRYRTDSVAVIVDHGAREFVEWLGDCFTPPRCGYYDAQRRMIWVGTQEGLVVGYNAATAVSVAEPRHRSSTGQPSAWIFEDQLHIRSVDAIQTVELYAINGDRVFHDNGLDNAGLIVRKCGLLPSGMYLLRVQASNSWSSTVVTVVR